MTPIGDRQRLRREGVHAGVSRPEARPARSGSVRCVVFRSSGTRDAQVGSHDGTLCEWVASIRMSRTRDCGRLRRLQSRTFRGFSGRRGDSRCGLPARACPAQTHSPRRQGEREVASSLRPRTTYRSHAATPDASAIHASAAAAADSGPSRLPPLILIDRAWSNWMFRSKMRGDIGCH